MTLPQTKKLCASSLLALFLTLSGCSSEVNTATLETSHYSTDFHSVAEAETVVNDILSHQVLRVGGTTRVDYTHLDRNKRAVLEKYLSFFETTNSEDIAPEKKVATLLNVYHTALLLSVRSEKDKNANLAELPVDFLQKQKLTLFGRDMSLDEVKQTILSSSDEVYLPFLISDGTVGGADFPLSLYTKEVIQSEGERAIKEYVNHPRGVRIDAVSNKMLIGELFKDNEPRIKKKFSTLNAFLSKYLENKSLKSVLEKQVGLEFQNNRTINSL